MADGDTIGISFFQKFGRTELTVHRFTAQKGVLSLGQLEQTAPDKPPRVVGDTALLREGAQAFGSAPIIALVERGITDFDARTKQAAKDQDIMAGASSAGAPLPEGKQNAKE